MSFWTENWLPFILNANSTFDPAPNIGVLDPYENADVQDVCHSFYKKYYGDDGERTVILGINPGRLGAGVTGISFTDPHNLQAYCGIKNDFERKQELSSKFIYQWLTHESTVDDFYKKNIIISVCPLGFIRHGKNVNYYDFPILLRHTEKLIIAHQDLVRSKGNIGPRVFVLGKGKNYTFFKKLNAKYKWYSEVVPLPHPRWVMQYRYHRRFEFMKQMHSDLA